MVIQGVTVNNKPLNKWMEDHPELQGETSQTLQEELKQTPRYKKPFKRFKVRGRSSRGKKLTKFQIIELKGVNAVETKNISNVEKVLVSLFQSDEISLRSMGEFFKKHNLEVNPKSSSAMMANAWNRLGPSGAGLLDREKVDKSYVYRWIKKPGSLEELAHIYRINSVASARSQKSQPSSTVTTGERSMITNLPKNIDVNVNFHVHVHVTFSFGQS